MSGAAAKIEAAPARSSSRPRQPTRVHDNGGTRGWKPAAVSGSPRIGRPDDFYEAQADLAAHQALTGPVGPPVRHAAAAPIAAPHLDAAAGALPARIAAAGAEGRALPDAQRDFFEPRFSHRFDGVRVHAGPAAAEAASAARAQAFTLGRNIYFGEGQYRPDSSAGQELLAHELAHTLQDRPSVVARRALNTTFDLPESDPAAEAGPEPSTGANLDDLAILTAAGPARGNTAVRDRLAQLDPAARTDAMAALRRRLPASELGKTDALGEGAQQSQVQDTPAPNQMPEIREGEAPPAPVTEDKGATPQMAAPTHQRAESAAAAKMQEAVKSMTAEVPLDGAAAQPPGSLDTSDVPAAGGGAGMAPANAAPSAAQNVVAMLGAGLAELEAAENLPVRFREETGGPPGDPEALARVTQSQSLASGFVGGTADKIRAVMSAALAVPAQLMTALGGARQAVAAQAAAQGAVLKGGAEAGRKQIRDQSTHVRGAIETRHGGADRDVSREVQDARGRAQQAYDAATGGLGKRAEREKSRIGKSYDDAREPMIGVGFEAGGRARAYTGDYASGLRKYPPKDGESSILDGPLHDNRLDAEADAAEKVGDEYAKSFEKSAREQADKLPQSRPEILAKVYEITTQARTGYADQFAQIVGGAGALETGAKARSRQAATHMRAALEANATQSQQALDIGEKQQGAALQGQADAAQGMLDQSVAGALSRFGDGVSQAVHQLTQGLSGFVASTAEIPAPESGELSAALAESDPATALVAMKGQVATVGPTLAGTLSEGQQASGTALAAAASAAMQGFAGSAAAFARSAGGINQQSAAGFRRLGAGNKRSAADVASDAEAGFTDAVQNADGAYSKFGDQVEENFATGRTQMLQGLLSPETHAKLASDMIDYGTEAAKHVQPRWKRVLKWVITIVVIVAVIAVTVLSAGALGPVGVVLLGATLGAAAGAVQTIASNLIDDRPWSEGVVKAMIVGAVGGAVGGAGGVLLKGVGSVGLRVALEGGVNIIGGVAGEALGSVAVGEPVNWTGALMGALVGAGIGAGLGIAGAIRGRIKIGGIGEPAAPPPPRPTVEPTPPAPAGRIRSALEAVKILAPRPGAVAPEVNVGAGAAAEPAPPTPSVETPGPTPTPSLAAEPTPALSPASEAAPVTARPPEATGVQLPEPTPAPGPAPEAAPAAPRPSEATGIQPTEPAPAPEAAPVAPRPPEPTGVQPPEPTPTPAPAPEAAPAASRPPEVTGVQPSEPVPSPAPAESAPPPAEAVTQSPREPSNVRDIRSARGRRYDPRVQRALDRTPSGEPSAPSREGAPTAEAQAEPVPQEIPEAVAEPVPQEIKRAAGDYETVAMASGRGRRPPLKPSVVKPTRPAPTPPTGRGAGRPPAMIIEPAAPRAPGAAGAEPGAASAEPTAVGPAPETAAPGGPGEPEFNPSPQDIDEFLGIGGPGEPSGPVGSRRPTAPPPGAKAEGPPVSIKEVEHPAYTGEFGPRPHQVLEIGSGPVQIDLGLPPDPAGILPANPDLIQVTQTDLNPSRPGVSKLDATKPLPPDLHGQFDTVLINNPHGYDLGPHLPEIAKALRPDGRIIIQGRAGLFAAQKQGINPEFNQLYQDAAKALQKANPGWNPSRGIQELPLDPTAPAPSNPPLANPGVLPGGLEVRIDLTPGPPKILTKPAHIMGADFRYTEGDPSGGPNARIIYTKAR